MAKEVRFDFSNNQTTPIAYFIAFSGKEICYLVALLLRRLEDMDVAGNEPKADAASNAAKMDVEAVEGGVALRIGTETSTLFDIEEVESVEVVEKVVEVIEQTNPLFTLMMSRKTESGNHTERFTLLESIFDLGVDSIFLQTLCQRESQD